MSYYSDQFEEYIDNGRMEDQIMAEEIYKYGSWAMWEPANSEPIAVRDMTTGHLENTIKYLKRILETETHKAWIEVMTQELESRK